MEQNSKNFIPALRFNIFTKYYDPLVRAATKEDEFKPALIKQAKLQNNQTILDLACGTATLAISIKKQFPKIKIFGIDADAEILQIAREKAASNNLEINFEQAFADKLSFTENSFDRVFSTLFFHHLTLDKKRQTLREILRVLKPKGEFHLADFALPRNQKQFYRSRIIRFLDGFETTYDNFRGRLKYLIEESGFSEVKRTNYFETAVGTIRLFKAIK